MRDQTNIDHHCSAAGGSSGFLTAGEGNVDMNVDGGRRLLPLKLKDKFWQSDQISSQALVLAETIHARRGESSA